MSRLRHLALSLTLLGNLLVSPSCAKQGEQQTRREEPPAVGVQRFVRQSFAHGVPFKEASRYGGDEDVDVLIGLLDDRKEEFHWPNVVTVLGMGRNPRATGALISFIERDSGKVSRQEHAAKTSAVIALGYLGGRDAKALDYLLESVDPQVWSKRLGWLPPYKAGVDERNVQLTTNAIQGLGLSGHQRAAETLLRLQQPGSLRIYQRDESLREVVSEALKTNDAVGKYGLEAYYSARQRQ